MVDQRLNLLFAGDFNDVPETGKAEDNDSSDSDSASSPDPATRRLAASQSPSKRRVLTQGRHSSRLSKQSKHTSRLSHGNGSQNSQTSITSYEETRIIASKVTRMLRGTRGYAADIKRALHTQGAVTISGQLITEELRAGFVDGTIDIEAFKAALK